MHAKVPAVAFLFLGLHVSAADADVSTAKQRTIAGGQGREATEGAAVPIRLALAQSAEGSASAATDQSAASPMLEEVIVSANKRDQLITEVPMALQAFGEETMKDFGMDNFAEYAQFVPGLSFSKQGANQTEVVIRGLSTGGQGGSGSQSRSLVGIYLDDIPTALSGQNFDPDLFDVERVEVLKGPQGTLFGDGAMAGAIRYVTSAPDLNGFSGRLNVQGSSTARRGGDEYAVRGMVNVPISSTLGLRAVGWYDDMDGWIDNIRTGDTNVGRMETYGARLAALYQPSEAFSITGRVLGQSTRQDGTLSADTTAAVTPNDGFLQDRDPEFYKDDSLLLSVTAEWTLDQGTVSSVSGYLDRDFLVQDSSTEGLNLFYFGPEVNLPNDRQFFPWKQTVLSQELRYTTTGARRVDYTAGIFLAKVDVEYPAVVLADGFDQYALDSGTVGSLEELYAFGCSPPEEAPDTSFCGDGVTTKQKQASAFADFTVHLTDRFDLLAGVRYFDWKQRFIQDYRGFLNGGPTFKDQSINEDGFNPRFGLSYGFSEGHRVFVSAAKGFRLGGVNEPLPASCNAEVEARGLTDSDRFDSDSLWTYEAGVKLLLADRRVLFNTSVFYTDWDDIQTSASISSCGYAVRVNSGKVESKGVEFDTTIAATERLQLVLSGSYTDAALAEDSPNLRAVAGDRVPNVPEWKASALVSYSAPIRGEWSGFGNFAVTAQGESSSTFSPTDPTQVDIPGSEVGTLRLGVETDRYRISLFADNLWDERQMTPDRNYRGPLIFTLRPRTIGLEVNVEY